MSRLAMLACGVVGHTEDEAGTPVTRVGGTGVMIAPCQALTATHVVRDLFKTNPDQGDHLLKRGSGYFVPSHSVACFQVDTMSDRAAEAATWSVSRAWVQTYTDVCLLEVAPDNSGGHRMLNRLSGAFPEWALLPPPVGDFVDLVGLPSTEISVSDRGWNFRFPFDFRRSQVTEVYHLRHDLGHYSFPGFLVDTEVDGGFSGGPVFHDGRLCGLVSGDRFGQTYISSLWPLCLMQIEYPNLGRLNAPEVVGDWFDAKRLSSVEWPEVKPLISERTDDSGRKFAHIDLPK